MHIQFTNRWWLHLGGTLGQLGATYCDRCARGGPAVRQDPYISPWITIEGDDRRPLVPSLSANYTRGDQGRSETIDLSPELDLKVSSRFTTSLSAEYNHNRNDMQYFGTFTDAAGAQHYTFAHLDQKTLSLTWRLGYTFTPTTSLQVYASPFVSKGTYSRRARGGGRRGRARTTRATGRTAIPPWPAIPAGSTSSSSAPTWCSAGSTGRARRCSWCGVRDGRVRRRSRAARVVPGRSRRPVRPAGERYLPGEGVVLAGEIGSGSPLSSDRAAIIFPHGPDHGATDLQRGRCRSADLGATRFRAGRLARGLPRRKQLFQVQIRSCNKCYYSSPGALQRSPSPFFTVHHGQDAQYYSPG